MAVRSDYHMHSWHSGDGNTPVTQMACQALRAGMEQICFTEHQDFDYPQIPDMPPEPFLLDTGAYFQDLRRCRKQYEDRIRICFGVELGLQPHLAERHRQYVRSYAFDFVIASSHICHGRDPYYASFYEGREEEEAYLEYFESVLENIRCFQDFDVYGHLDYVVRCGPCRDREYSYKKYRDILDQILLLLVQSGKGLELNTGGLKYGLQEPNPCSAVLRRYRALGGETVTVGSDAHAPEFIGYAFDRAAEILKDCGFSYYATFQERVPKYRKL